MIEKDWLFSSDEYICDLRTVGVLVKNNRVLVQRDKNGSEYALPGGRITRILQTMPLFSSFHFAQLIVPYPICGGLQRIRRDRQRPVPAGQGVFLHGAIAGFHLSCL